MVIWIIGLSGSGKTTLANHLASALRSKNKAVVVLDGDVIREIFGNDLGYSMSDRFLNANRICNLGKFLSEQNIIVISPILSLFVENQEWNRENINKYYQVYIDTPMDDLIKRDSKGLYKKYLDGSIKDVAGMDLEFPSPYKSDLIIKNSKDKDYLLSFSNTIIDYILN